MIQRDIADRIDEPLITLKKAHDLIAVRRGALHHAANHRVQPRAIATGRQNPNSLTARHYSSPQSFRWLAFVSLTAIVGRTNRLVGKDSRTLRYNRSNPNMERRP